jgi:hypothetical protein
MMKRSALALAGLMLWGCASTASNSSSPTEAWRLVPETTILGERRQFFVYGHGLDSAKVIAPSSVTAERGRVNPGGRAFSLYLKVDPIVDDSTALSDKPGRRTLKIRTPDTTVTLVLKVLDEVER